MRKLINALGRVQQYLPPVPTRTTYADRETDECFLEDETGRVRLVGDGPWRQGLVTGEFREPRWAECVHR